MKNSTKYNPTDNPIELIIVSKTIIEHINEDFNEIPDESYNLFDI